MSWSGPTPIVRSDPSHAIVIEPGTHRHCEVVIVDESRIALTISLDADVEQPPETPLMPTSGATVFVARPGRGWSIGTVGPGRGNELMVRLDRPFPVQH